MTLMDPFVFWAMFVPCPRSVRFGNRAGLSRAGPSLNVNPFGERVDRIASLQLRGVEFIRGRQSSGSREMGHFFGWNLRNWNIPSHAEMEKAGEGRCEMLRLD
jgi:hypothetical protein